MKNKKTLMFVMSFLAIALISGFIVSAHWSDFSDNPEERPFFNETRHEAMQQAFENKDYSVWKSLVQEQQEQMSGKGYGRSRLLEVINEDNFDRFVDMHNAKISGDQETANEIRQELGIGFGQEMKMQKAYGLQGAKRGIHKAQGQGQFNGNCPGF